MRPSRPALVVIALGFGLVAAALAHLGSLRLGTLALFAAAATLTELLEEADRERSREPVETDRFRLASAVHVAAVIVLGPWAGTLVAALGVTSGSLYRGAPVRATAFDASSFALAAWAAGWGFRLAGGDAGSLVLLKDLVPLAVLAVVYLTARALLLEVMQARESFEPRLAASIGEAGLGAAVALLAFEHPWNVLVLVPVAFALHLAQLRLARLQRETLRALETFANIVDERDPSTYRHSIRVAGYVDQLARALALPFSEIDRLRWAGRLHDLGKVAVDASVLRKPDRLDASEWAAVRRHPRLSARLLQRFRFVATQARAVELHHERVDGGGYYGVGAEDLPLAAHFLIVADSFDAMTTDRPYRPGLSHDAALAEIERNVGTQFHPAVARAFVAVRRGLDPADVLTPEELAEIRGASASYRLGVVPGDHDLRERPELVALGGLVLALGGLGFHQPWLAVVGAAVAAGGLTLRGLARVRATRVAGFLRRALGLEGRPAVFEEIVERLSRSWKIGWAAFVSWDEDGLGGSMGLQHGDGPTEAAIVSWLVREAESGSDVIVLSGAELGREGIELALPLRRDNSALVGFLVFEAERLPPRHVELALLECLDELGLAFADRPEVEAARPSLAPAV